jgi:hypothetical protein
VRVEESSLSNSGILLFVILTTVIFFGSAAALMSLFPRIKEQLVNEKNAASGPTESVTLRAQEDERLTTYGYVDKEKGVVRIPIDVAMQKVVEEAKK